MTGKLIEMAQYQVLQQAKHIWVPNTLTNLYWSYLFCFCVPSLFPVANKIPFSHSFLIYSPATFLLSLGTINHLPQGEGRGLARYTIF
jgi:hypothetical protein